MKHHPPIQDFDLQTKKIRAALPDIDALFRSHFVYALPSTGIYTPPDQIWKSMLDTVADSAKKAQRDCISTEYGSG